MRRAENLTTFMCRLSSNLGASTSLNPLGLYRLAMELLYLHLENGYSTLLQNSANFYFIYDGIHQTTGILVNFVLNKEHFVPYFVSTEAVLEFTKRSNRNDYLDK